MSQTSSEVNKVMSNIWKQVELVIDMPDDDVDVDININAAAAAMGRKGGKKGGKKTGEVLAPETRVMLATKANRARNGKVWTDKEQAKLRKALDRDVAAGKKK